MARVGGRGNEDRERISAFAQNYHFLNPIRICSFLTLKDNPIHLQNQGQQSQTNNVLGEKAVGED